MLNRRERKAIDKIEMETVCRKHLFETGTGNKTLESLLQNGYIIKTKKCAHHSSNCNEQGYALTDNAYKEKYNMTKSQITNKTLSRRILSNGRKLYENRYSLTFPNGEGPYLMTSPVDTSIIIKRSHTNSADNWSCTFNNQPNCPKIEGNTAQMAKDLFLLRVFNYI